MTTTPLIKSFLRSPDELTAVLEVAQITSTLYPANLHTVPDVRNRYILAIISHKDGWNPAEEGCLFVFKFCRLRNMSVPATGAKEEREELDLQRVFPIYGEFGISMSQMRGEASGLRSRPVSTAPNILEQTRSMITLSITPAEGALGQTPHLSFCTSDVDGLKLMVAECKRLKGSSDLDANAFFNLAQSTTNFSWLKHYLAKRTTISALISVPQDLRQVNQPLLHRLSPACAGNSEYDQADIQIMRDDWIRGKAQEMARQGKRRLTLRLGTFNVNGKMPSQDLSSWVQGNLNQSSTQKERNSESKETSSSPLSPLQRISPVSIPKNPFNWIRVKSSCGPEEDVVLTEKPPIRVDVVDSGDPDMFVFAFQELDLSTEALLYSTSTVREDAWCSAVFAALGEKGMNYEKLASKQLVGMLLVIIIKKSLKQCFGDVRTTAAGAGILGIMGNKGGTAIRLAFTPPIVNHENSTLDSPKFLPGSTTLTFVDTHLAAFDDMAEKRNSDFHDLSRRLLFESVNTPKASKPSSSPMSANSDATDRGNFKSEADLPAAYESSDRESLGQALGFVSPLSIYDTDVLFWLVNLNYRVDVPDHVMRRILRDEDWDINSKVEALFRFDQLKRFIKDKAAFVGFREGDIKFMPSYRFSPGLAMDRLGYDLKRRPAWTDRILYMHGATSPITQLSYACYHITLSDHRPVASDFVVDVRNSTAMLGDVFNSLQVDYFDVEEYHAHVKKLFHQVSPLDMETGHDKGGLKIDGTFIDFDKIYYGKPVERKIVLTNTGKSPCAFRFVPTQLGLPTHPEWLRIYPMMGILLANEITEVILRAEVDNATAPLLNLRPKDLSGTLILHTMFGKDHFISLSGEYQYTCFANKLSLLTRLRGPIRFLRSPNDLMPNGRSAPREIIRLVNWMMSNPASSNEIFIARGDESTIDIIHECLDTGEEFSYSPETSDARIRLAFADTLLRFLDSLPEPVMSASLHPLCPETSSRDEAFELLDKLPPASVNVWISLTAFLHYICQDLEVDEQERIAAAVAPVLLRDDPNSLPISPKEKCRFLMFFIS